MDNSYRRTLEDTQREKYDLQRRVTALSTELDVARDEKASVAAKRMDLERTVRTLERDVSEKISKFDGLIRELEDTRKRSDKAERQVQHLTHEVDFKNQELESIRKELKDLWNSHNQMTEHSAQQAQLIHQLQSLQHDTQIMIKNQEDAFTVESKSLQQMYQDVCVRYEASKQIESDLRQQILHLKKDMMEQDDIIAKQREQVEAMREQLNRPDPANCFMDADLAAADRSTLEARRDLGALRQLEKTIDKLDRSIDRDGTLEFDLSHTQRSGRHSTPSRDGQDGDSSLRMSRRARSLSPRRYQQEAGESSAVLEQRLADAQRLLELRDNELDALRRAHARRLERLKSVQHSEKLLQEQIKTYEDRQPNYIGAGKKKKVQRSDPRQLRRENSDAVWNELSYFKTQNRNLEVERLSLQEELDELRVQASVDAATVHELRVNLQAQREEFEYQLKKREAMATDRKDVEGELMMLRSRVQNKDHHINKLEKDLQEMAVNRDTILEEKKALKTQANELQQEVSQCRMKIADLRHTLQRQQRALEESIHTQGSHKSREASQSLRQTSAAGKPLRRKPTQRFKKPAGRNNSSVKQYQRALNTSIEKMRGVFTDFGADGWEEVTESGETEDCGEWEEDDDTEATVDSLGATIARHARESTPGTDSTDTTPTPSLSLRRTLAARALQKGNSRPRRAPTRSKGSQTKPSAPGKNNIRVQIHSPPAVVSPRRNRSPTPRERVVLREMATSPIPWETGQETRAAAVRPLPVRVGGRQLSVLKQRVSHLSQQLATFRATRTLALKKFAEMKATNQQLTSDLNQANQRLKTARLTCQRLSSDMERLQQEKKSMEEHVMAKDKSEGAEKQNDNDKRLLEARLKMSTSEVSRQAATIRSLKTEVDTLQDQIRGFQDRINHLERDNNQKRNLVESQRIKLKATQDISKVHDDTMEELQTKLKLSAESTDKMRIQLDSLKKRMKVVMHEKRDYEDKYLQVSLALEKKAKDLSTSREKCSQLEAAMAQLEALSQQQLQRVATHSEAAVDAAQAQMSATHGTLTGYQQFVKLLCTELLDRVTRARKQLRETAAAREEQARVAHDSDTASLKRAQDTARDILNISQSDLDDIMSADGDHAAEEVVAVQEGKKDRKWLRKCEKIMATKDEFVRPLVSLILLKVDERADLLMRLAS
ncbi:hypothetical protein V1264_001490 [Littorina saxatilis]